MGEMRNIADDLYSLGVESLNLEMPGDYPEGIEVYDEDYGYATKWNLNGVYAKKIDHYRNSERSLYKIDVVLKNGFVLTMDIEAKPWQEPEYHKATLILLNPAHDENPYVIDDNTGKYYRLVRGMERAKFTPVRAMLVTLTVFAKDVIDKQIEKIEKHEFTG